MNAEIVDKIIGKFGTQDRLGQAIGCHQSTIAWWKKRGVIPTRQQPKLLEAARRLGIDLSPADFFGEASASQPESGASGSHNPVAGLPSQGRAGDTAPGEAA